MENKLFSFGEKFRPVSLDCTPEETFALIKKDDFSDFAQRFGLEENISATFANENSRNMRNRVVITSKAFSGRISLIAPDDIMSDVLNIFFFINRRAFFVVSSVPPKGRLGGLKVMNAAVRQTLSADYKEKSFCMCIYNFFEGLISRDNELIEAYEKEIVEFEDAIEQSVSDMRFNSGLLKMRKKLFVLHSYYEQLLEIATRLEDNVHGVFDAVDTDCFSALASHIKRLCDNVQILRETLIQIRQEYNSVMDYNLNKTMKFHTVLTTLFLPLNLLVGWYGMNFDIPEFGFKFAYPVFAAFCVAIFSFVIYLLKKKQLL